MNQQGKCYKCGGFLAVIDAEDAMICPFCGKPIVAEKAIRSFRENGQPGRKQPTASEDTYTDQHFVVERGTLVSCTCFTEAEIRIPDGIRAIGDAAFYLCESLRAVSIPEGVTSIGSYAFAGCYSMRSVNIPKSVQFIGEGAFLADSDLTISVVQGSYGEKWVRENDIPLPEPDYIQGEQI